MKGIILAGGSGSRLYPTTLGTSKHLLPIYDKPMIYYSLSVLLMAGIKEILIICTRKDLSSYQSLFGDGSYLGIQLRYGIQEEPKGIADAFIIAEDFIKNDSVMLILGDNFFYGQGFHKILKNLVLNYDNSHAIIFSYYVLDPKSYGVVEFDKSNKVISIEEKPDNPKSNYAITGLYIYDSSVVEIAKSLVPSSRGELEITDVNNYFLKKNKLEVFSLGRGFTWLDCGTPNNLLEASNFVKTIQERQGLYISCLEEISYINGWISNNDIELIGKENSNSSYHKYLKKIIQIWKS